MDSELLKALGQNGPWAIMAGFLLLRVIKQSDAYQKQNAELLSEFKPILLGLKTAVDELKDEIRRGHTAGVK